jgi:hypothetical protein
MQTGLPNLIKKKRENKNRTEITTDILASYSETTGTYFFFAPSRTKAKKKFLKLVKIISLTKIS